MASSMEVWAVVLLNIHDVNVNGILNKYVYVYNDAVSFGHRHLFLHRSAKSEAQNWSNHTF